MALRESRPTLYDVARLACVSHQTVSNVLNNPDRVRPGTQQRVMTAIAELGFETSAAARSLAAGQSNVIGFQAPRVRSGAAGAFLDHFLVALVEAGRGHSRQLLVFTEEGDGTSEHERLYRAGMVDSIIIADTALHDPRIPALQRAGVPFVSFGRTTTTVPYAWVDVDNRAGMIASLRHLADRGHRWVAYLDAAADTYFGQERLDGYREGVAAFGLEREAALVVTANEDLADTRQTIAKMLDLAVPPTAVVAGSDFLAATVIDVARARGSLIGPSRLAVVGFDDTPLASLIEPSLTTIRQPLDMIAQELVAIASGMSDGPPTHRLIEPTLVPRLSS